jgi:hypothetical protein
MHVKLLRTARALKIWRQAQCSEWKLREAILHIILLELERAQERRTLTTEELEFKKSLKAKSIGLAAIQKAKARQHSRLTWIRKGDANTRFFNFMPMRGEGKHISVPSKVRTVWPSLSKTKLKWSLNFSPEQLEPEHQEIEL